MSKSSQGEKDVHLHELTDQVFTLKQQLEASVRDLEESRGECQDKDRQIGKLETEVEQKTGELSGATGSLEELKKQMRSQEEELSQLQLQLAKVKIKG